MHASSNALNRDANRSYPLALHVPLVQFQLNQFMVLTQLATAAWAIGHYQMSRYSTFLAGGVPLA